MSQKSIYFPGLNGIRAIAASIVFLFHIDQFFGLFGLPVLGYHKTGMAEYGVVLFFCLSGYLITYLLLSEKTKFGNVDFKKFYVRRILRIWPLYYLIILLGFFIVLTFENISYNKNNFAPTVGMFTLLLSNVAYFLGLTLTPITPLWSVSVEEQFYAFWPFLINKSKKILFSLLGVIVLFLIFKIGTYLLGSGVYYFIKLTAFDVMSIGGVAAYLVFKKNKILNILYNPVMQGISWAWLVISCVYKPISLWAPIDYEIHSIFYAIIIVNVSTNSRSLFRLENKAFNFIGQISYGLYVYHMIIICIASYFLKEYIAGIEHSFIQYFLVFLSVVPSTFMIAAFSYKYFESKFLKLKSGYSKIHSTNEAPVHTKNVEIPKMVSF